MNMNLNNQIDLNRLISNQLDMLSFQDKLVEVIHLFDNWLLEPVDIVQLEEWVHNAQGIVETFDFPKGTEEKEYMDKIIEMYSSEFQDEIKSSSLLPLREEVAVQSHMDELLQRKQTVQRTPEWYAQMSNVISASEVHKLSSTPYERGQFVISKAAPYVPRNQPLAVMSDRMSAFDWGIRFEPVVKQLYELKYSVTIKDLGRLTHQEDNKCCASPDGLIYSTTAPEHKGRVGRLIEIKCPVTREIDSKIPKEYSDQMQLQLHVAGINACDYVEVSFSSTYNSKYKPKEGPSMYYGFIALVRRMQMADEEQEFYYKYGPVNDMEWPQQLQDTMDRLSEVKEEIVEMIPWRVMEWREDTVRCNESWWLELKPKMESFWEDVEKEKRGEFVAPESSRPKKKAKVDVCQIIFTKLDEDGK